MCPFKKVSNFVSSEPVYFPAICPSFKTTKHGKIDTLQSDATSSTSSTSTIANFDNFPSLYFGARLVTKKLWISLHGLHLCQNE